MRFLHSEKVETSVLSCLTIFLRIKGSFHKLSLILEIAPISTRNLGYDIVDYTCRKIGISLCRLDIASSGFLDDSTHPTLVVRRSEYSFLILDSNQNSCIAVSPGYPKSVMIIDKKSDFFDDLIFAAKMSSPSPPQIKRGSSQKIRLFLLPREDSYLAKYDEKAALELNARLLTQPVNQHVSQNLKALSIPELLITHLSLAPESPELYGVMRKVELRRNSVFMNSDAVENAVKELMLMAELHDPKKIMDIYAFAARLFIDFLTIHPFNNGNRRMAMEVVTVYFRRFGMEVNWFNITTSEIYFWTRCAARGHFRGLESLIFLNTVGGQCHNRK
jgi:hypothetical protein